MKHFELLLGSSQKALLEQADALVGEGYVPIGGVLLDRSAQLPYTMIMYKHPAIAWRYDTPNAETTIATPMAVPEAEASATGAPATPVEGERGHNQSDNSSMIEDETMKGYTHQSNDGPPATSEANPPATPPADPKGEKPSKKKS